MRTVSGLDVHKDSIFMCILDEQGKKTEKKLGLTVLSSLRETEKKRGKNTMPGYCSMPARMRN